MRAAELWIKLCIMIGFFCILSWLTLSGIVQSPDIDSEKEMAGLQEVDWKKVNFYQHPIPDEGFKKKDNIVINASKVKVLNVDVFYREAQLPKAVSSTGQSILLLHGQRFSSKTWEDLGTLHLMGALGHRVIAVDLPGYGESKTSYNGDRSSFMFELCTTLGLQTPVIVSPSMSGTYSMPFLASHADKFSGFLPVAPVGTDKVAKAVLQTVQVPTLILFGSNDKMEFAANSKENLKNIPKSQLVVFEGAGHACYLDQPDNFHKILHNFLLLLRI